MHLNEQIALVTGGSKGLGRAFAGALAEAGTWVAVTAKHEGELDDTIAEIEERGGRGFAFPADVTDGEAVARLVAAVEETLGRADALSGCYLDVRDDIDALLRRAEDVRREQKQRLRLVT